MVATQLPLYQKQESKYWLGYKINAFAPQPFLAYKEYNCTKHLERVLCNMHGSWQSILYQVLKQLHFPEELEWFQRLIFVNYKGETGQLPSRDNLGISWCNEAIFNCLFLRWGSSLGLPLLKHLCKTSFFFNVWGVMTFKTRKGDN